MNIIFSQQEKITCALKSPGIKLHIFRTHLVQTKKSLSYINMLRYDSAIAYKS